MNFQKECLRASAEIQKGHANTSTLDDGVDLDQDSVYYVPNCAKNKKHMDKRRAVWGTLRVLMLVGRLQKNRMLMTTGQ
ncbi:hypothetical protein RIF29_21956 [Crotalaria pallida]|uniref:Uncharacterized protein n=1 Tax=Crotalaria pallida TaxID=3830 RepID=A0AAN9F3I9_CROPI